CRHFLDHQQARRAGRHRPHLNLIIDLDHHVANPTAGATTADGTRFDRATIDRLLCDCALHRVVTAGRSTILDYGTATRTIPAPLFNALVIRDRHCRFPGCDGPPHWTEGHHVRAWEQGGATQPSNLVLVCSRHHHLLHRPGWHAKLLPDATLEVTDPHGRVRSTSPPSGRPPPQLPLE
ncbi:MAG: HNH endonuclease signature motif containing protein, partial [Acidimicrobiales bacterium]